MDHFLLLNESIFFIVTEENCTNYLPYCRDTCPIVISSGPHCLLNERSTSNKPSRVPICIKYLNRALNFLIIADKFKGGGGGTFGSLQ